VGGYLLEQEGQGTNLVHFMKVLEPCKGAGALRLMYAVFGLPKKQRAGGLTTLTNIKAAAEREPTTSCLDNTEPPLQRPDLPRLPAPITPPADGASSRPRFGIISSRGRRGDLRTTRCDCDLDFAGTRGVSLSSATRSLLLVNLQGATHLPQAPA
jgi:hypothetical protein